MLQPSSLCVMAFTWIVPNYSSGKGEGYTPHFPGESTADGQQGPLTATEPQAAHVDTSVTNTQPVTG